MNVFFAMCPNLDGRNVTDFHLLSCVHAYQHDSDEKDFSIYCDAQLRSMEIAGEDEAVLSPRYSGVQYASHSSMHDVYEGQVVGIIWYKTRDQASNVYLLINRFQVVNEQDYITRYLPQRMVRYATEGTKVITDCVPISNVKGPLFVVPALDKCTDISTFGNVGENKAKYYLLSSGKVMCTSILSYETYLRRNDTYFSNRRHNSSSSYFNYNPFLSVEDMENIKSLVHVTRNIDTYDNTFVEAFQFDFDCDNEDILLMHADEI